VLRFWNNYTFLKLKGKKMSEWQPIETAPKDGTIIIIDGGTAEWNPNKFGWFSHQGQAIIQWNVTHWMPLPKLPKEIVRWMNGNR
jgi:hypothetical protein